MQKTTIEWSEPGKWCTACKQRHLIQAFGKDRTRYDGLAACCLASKRVKIRKIRVQFRSGWLKPVRDGDKLQARRRINYLVEQGRIPHPDDLPCIDCGDEIFLRRYRHEYDHACGYDGLNQLYVEPVCSRCHHGREKSRSSLKGT